MKKYKDGEIVESGDKTFIITKAGTTYSPATIARIEDEDVSVLMFHTKKENPYIHIKADDDRADIKDITLLENPLAPLFENSDMEKYYADAESAFFAIGLTTIKNGLKIYKKEDKEKQRIFIDPLLHPLLQQRETVTFGRTIEGKSHIIHSNDVGFKGIIAVIALLGVYMRNNQLELERSKKPPPRPIYRNDDRFMKL